LNEEDGRYYFRLRDLAQHLEKEGFRTWGRNQLSQRLKDVGGTKFLNYQGYGISAYWVPRSLFQSNVVEFPLPPSKSSPV
jgi:hypothetical protein